MTEFDALFSTNTNNTQWETALQKGWRAARIIAVKSAMDTKHFIAAALGMPGIHRISNAEQDFAWVDGAVSCPMSEEGAQITLGITWGDRPPPFVPQGAIVWLGETPERSRRYWVSWPVGTPYNPQRVWVEDIT